MATADGAQWDAAGLVARARALILSSNYEKVAEARAQVDAAIDEWVRAALALAPGSEERARAAESVAAAWGSYAQLEMELRQFKQATKVFESAVACAITRGATQLWLQYAAFCIDRKKFANARKVFARAIAAVPENERDQVWAQFHAFVREHIDPSMSLEALQAQMQAALPGLSPRAGVGAVASSEPATAVNARQTASEATPSISNDASVESIEVTPAVATSQTTDVTTDESQRLEPVLPNGIGANAGEDDTATATPSTSLSDGENVSNAPEVANNGGESITDANKQSGDGSKAPMDLEQPEGPETIEGPEKPSQSPELVVDGDSALAFVDKTGSEPVPPALVKRPSDVESLHEPNKRAKLDAEPPSSPQVKVEAQEEPPDFLVEIPKELPYISECPSLMFDPPGSENDPTKKTAANDLSDELLERLSVALRDSAVFQGVRDLCTNQHQRERDMLHRWQELVGMQMKERTELSKRQAGAEEQHGFEDTRGLIALKMTHLEQRHEFVNRCLTSQKQFLDICAMDRKNALRAQQISMENMKIPDMVVTTDAEKIKHQRAIASVILEAEVIWRTEHGGGQTTSTSASSTTGKCADPASGVDVKASSVQASRDPRRNNFASGDSMTGGYSAGRGGRGGFGGRGNSTRGGRGGFGRRDGGEGRGGFRRDDNRFNRSAGPNDRFQRDPRRDLQRDAQRDPQRDSQRDPRRDPRKPLYDNRSGGPSSRPGDSGFGRGGGRGNAPNPNFGYEAQQPPRMQREYDTYEPQFRRPGQPGQDQPPPYYASQQQVPHPAQPRVFDDRMQYGANPTDPYDSYGRPPERNAPAQAPYAPFVAGNGGPPVFAPTERYVQDPRRPNQNDRYRAAPQSNNWQRGPAHPTSFQERPQGPSQHQLQPPPQQQQQQQQPQPYRRRDPPGSDRQTDYSVGILSGNEFRQPPPNGDRYGRGAPPKAFGPPAEAAHRPQRYGHPQAVTDGIPVQQPYEEYDEYDYPPGPPQQQQQFMHPGGGRGGFDGPRGRGSGRGGFSAQPPPQAYQRQDPYPPQGSDFGGYASKGPRYNGGRGRGRGGRRGGGGGGGGPRPFRR